MGNFLIPANSKKSMLILGLFRPIDLGILLIGSFITLMSAAFFDLTSIPIMLIAIAPGAIAAFLVFPVPNYHNILSFLTSMYVYYTEQQNFIWKGWCHLDGDSK